MYKSFIEKKPVGMDTNSIASGLAPPFAGTSSCLCQSFSPLLQMRFLQILFSTHYTEIVYVL